VSDRLTPNVIEAVQPAEPAPPALVNRLHGWITTVDHKRLGIMYILYALVFLVIGESKPRSCGFSSSRRTISLFRPRSLTGCSPCMAPR
jgi:hypothetical protein